MYNWRITKYNPTNRNSDGEYTTEEWTSISDVGRSYNGKEFTLNDYLDIENKYVDVVKLFMDSQKIEFLTVVNLEKSYKELKIENQSQYFSEEMIGLYSFVSNSQALSVYQVECLTRLILREKLWCKLENSNLMYVHFGYDYYMYIGTLSKCDDVIDKIVTLGLFAEEFSSPYI